MHKAQGKKWEDKAKRWENYSVEGRIELVDCQKKKSMGRKKL